MTIRICQKSLEDNLAVLLKGLFIISQVSFPIIAIIAIFGLQHDADRTILIIMSVFFGLFCNFMGWLIELNPFLMINGKFKFFAWRKDC